MLDSSAQVGILGGVGKELSQEDRRRDARLRLAYGITLAEYDALFKAQGGHCALCPATPKKKSLHVDHDHKTGQVRGLLCYRCNRALPAYLTADWLRRAADYVERGTNELPGENESPGRAATSDHP